MLRKNRTKRPQCLVVVWSVLLLQRYLKGFRFTLRNDHDGLKGILNVTDSSSKLGCCGLILSNFESNVVQCAGIKHQASETLSRIRTTGKDEIPIEDDIPVVGISPLKPLKRRRVVFLTTRRWHRERQARSPTTGGIRISNNYRR